MSQDGTVLAWRGGAPALVPAADLPVPQPADMAALARRVAALEARQGNVPLSGALPVATLQIGTTTVPVPVAGLLATDRVSVQPGADLPAGLLLAWARPRADGVLAVALTAIAAVAIKSPIPLAVTAQR